MAYKNSSRKIEAKKVPRFEILDPKIAPLVETKKIHRALKKFYDRKNDRYFSNGMMDMICRETGAGITRELTYHIATRNSIDLSITFEEGFFSMVRMLYGTMSFYPCSGNPFSLEQPGWIFYQWPAGQCTVKLTRALHVLKITTLGPEAIEDFEATTKDGITFGIITLPQAPDINYN